MRKVDEAIRRYQLDDDYSLRSHHLKGVDFANEWTIIHDCEMLIHKGYAWDGCTPTYYVPIFGWIGVPDGERDANGYPQAYYASLVHDVLCQFRHEIKISKAATIELFRDLLLFGGFSVQRADLYATAVRWLGPQSWPVIAPDLPPIVTS